MSLANKTLFVTGASRGIGLAIALRAARDGANIAIAAKTVKPDPRLPGTIFTAAEEIEKAGGKALPLACDIRDEQSVEKSVAETVAKFGGIDILVNNASAISLTGTLATPMKRYDLMHQINARGTFLVSQKCIPHLLKAANPHVLNLSPPLDFDVKWFANHAGLHAGQVSACRSTPGRWPRSSRARHRLQLPVAAHRHRHRRDPERAGRRGRHEALPQARDHGRRGLRDLQPAGARSAPATSSSTTRCWRPRASPISTSTPCRPARR